MREILQILHRVSCIFHILFFFLLMQILNFAWVPYHLVTFMRCASIIDQTGITPLLLRLVIKQQLPIVLLNYVVSVLDDLLESLITVVFFKFKQRGLGLPNHREIRSNLWQQNNVGLFFSLFPIAFILLLFLLFPSLLLLFGFSLQSFVFF